MSDAYNKNYVLDLFDEEDNVKYNDLSMNVEANQVERFTICKNACTVDGLILEMGVFNGDTLRVIKEVFDEKVYGFDSWEGLPEDEADVPRIGSFMKGCFKVQKIPEEDEKTVLVGGWFKDTLPIFARSHPQPIKFLHVDSDNYNSAKDIFNNLGHLIVPGTVILFDEFKVYEGWRLREYRAFKEFIKSTPFSYKYIVRCGNNERVALQII